MRYIILGAGPAGLTLACSLLSKGFKDFLVLEKEEEAGGLCRSTIVDGAPFDTGGGHFLDTRARRVTDFLFRYMDGSEWDTYERDSRIDIRGMIINNPIEANIWQFDMDTQVEYLKSIAQAGCNTGLPCPKSFVDWIYWKLGKSIAEDYMLPYNRKMFGGALNELGTYWLEKLPDVSFEDTLRSCLERRPYGRQPAHSRFFYPEKYGYGEIWKRMAESLGDRLISGYAVKSLNLNERVINGEYRADVIINTVPWTDIQDISGGSEGLKDHIGALRHTSIYTEYHPERMDTPAHWIYYPDEGLDYHRVLVRHNFCPGSRGHWREINAERFHEGGFISFRNEYAYPLNTVGKEEHIAALLRETAERQVIGLGRWGEWQHFNSDVVCERALALSDRLVP